MVAAPKRVTSTWAAPWPLHHSSKSRRRSGARRVRPSRNWRRATMSALRPFPASHRGQRDSRQKGSLLSGMIEMLWKSGAEAGSALVRQGFEVVAEPRIGTKPEDGCQLARLIAVQG